MATNGATVFIDQPELLAAQQRIDLNILLAANEAVWSALAAKPLWRFATPPHECCILLALAVLDTLHAWGRTDAKLMRSGLDVRLLTGRLPYILTIGDPSSPRIEGKWPAHATVKLGDILLDPTHRQTRRLWNYSPRSAAFLVGAPDGHQIDVGAGCHARSIVLHRYWREGHQYQVTYFRLPRAVDLATRKWRLAPDARPERRAAIVEAAVRRKAVSDLVAAPQPARSASETIVSAGYANSANLRRKASQAWGSFNA